MGWGIQGKTQTELQAEYNAKQVERQNAKDSAARFRSIGREDRAKEYDKLYQQRDAEIKSFEKDNPELIKMSMSDIREWEAQDKAKYDELSNKSTWEQHGFATEEEYNNYLSQSAKSNAAHYDTIKKMKETPDPKPSAPMSFSTGGTSSSSKSSDVHFKNKEEVTEGKHRKNIIDAVTGNGKGNGSYYADDVPVNLPDVDLDFDIGGLSAATRWNQSEYNKYGR